MRTLTRVASVLGLGLFLAVPALGDEIRVVVRSARVHLGDIASNVAPSLQGVDLGPAPPPGQSRLFSRAEVAEKLLAVGVAPSRLELPMSGVRVETEARRFAPEELGQMAEPALRAALPEGVRLISLKAHQGHVLAPSIQVGRVRLPRLAMRDGEQTQTATVELVWGREVLMRLPVQITVSVSGQKAGTLVPRGSTVTLVIQRGSVEISTQGETLAPGRVGDVVAVRVGVTKKTLPAKLTQPGRAEVEL